MEFLSFEGDRETKMSEMKRRSFVRMGMAAAVGTCVAAGGWSRAMGQPSGGGVAAPLFDGKTLDGWIDLENSATSLSSDAVVDAAALAGRLVNGTDAVSVMLRGKLEALGRGDLASYSAANANAKALLSATVKDINQVIAGPSIYDAARFGGVTLRPETEAMLKGESRRVCA